MVRCQCFGFISSMRLIDSFPTDKFDCKRMSSKQNTARRMVTLCCPSGYLLSLSADALPWLLLWLKVSRMRQYEAPYMFRYGEDHWKVAHGASEARREARGSCYVSELVSLPAIKIKVLRSSQWTE
jgi:hypothetical protein